VSQMSASHLFHIGWLDNFNSFVHMAAGVHVDGLAILTQLALNLAALGTAALSNASNVSWVVIWSPIERLEAGLVLFAQCSWPAMDHFFSLGEVDDPAVMLSQTGVMLLRNFHLWFNDRLDLQEIFDDLPSNFSPHGKLLSGVSFFSKEPCFSVTILGD
jgi:hypothetical protein